MKVSYDSRSFLFFYIANRIRKATIKQNSPIASDRANPRMAYENSCCFRDGFLWMRTNCQWIYRNKKTSDTYKSILIVNGYLHMLWKNWDKPSIADDETAKDCPNSSTRSSYSDCGSSSTNKLGSGVDVPADSAGLDAPQWDLGEGALWHHSNIALEQEKSKTVNLHFHLRRINDVNSSWQFSFLMLKLQPQCNLSETFLDLRLKTMCY